MGTGKAKTASFVEKRKEDGYRLVAISTECNIAPCVEKEYNNCLVKVPKLIAETGVWIKTPVMVFWYQNDHTDMEIGEKVGFEFKIGDSNDEIWEKFEKQKFNWEWD